MPPQTIRNPAQDAPGWVYPATSLRDLQELKRGRMTTRSSYMRRANNLARKAELQREIDMLRKPPSTSPSETLNDVLVSPETIDTEVQAGILGLEAHLPTSQTTSSAASAPHSLTSSAPRHFDASGALSQSASMRSLDGISIDSGKIGDCFSL